MELGHLADDLAQLVTMGSMRDPRVWDDAARRGFLDGEILDRAHVKAAGDRPPECEHGGATCDRLLAERRGGT
jgi:hypothetical protein